MKNSEILEEIGACDNSQLFADGFNTPQEAWENCDRPDWMIWLLIKLTYRCKEYDYHNFDLALKLIYDNCKIPDEDFMHRSDFIDGSDATLYYIEKKLQTGFIKNDIDTQSRIFALNAYAMSVWYRDVDYDTFTFNIRKVFPNIQELLEIYYEVKNGSKVSN